MCSQHTEARHYSPAKSDLNDFCQVFPHRAISSPPLHHQRSPKKFTNTYEPLTSSPFRLTANSHPLNGTCHGSACPLTKDNCDLDKHWGGGNIKAKVKSSFSSSALRFTYNTTGTKSCSYLRF